ncbi:MAG TPA: hypothetical protein DDW90_09460 [Cyanobacteria bacterium UBA9971]|nr:hypothetical protein [Cyanobacteria bacterium UBA9971]
MYIEGPLKSGKSSFLVEKFIELVESGILTSEILVITLNSYKKNVFFEKIRERLAELQINGLGELPIFTFNGIVYNSIKSNWSLVEELIPDNRGKREIIPNLCGLEVSELFIKSCIKKINKREKLEESLRDYKSHKSLKHQILRRHSLITNNFLDQDEIIDRSEILDESMGKLAQEVLEELRKSANNYRCFDQYKQISTFFFLVDSGKIDFGRIKYLLVDDFDETTYSAQYFISKLIPEVKEFFIAVDPQGSSRRGYLCANPCGYEDIKASNPSEIINLTSKKPSYDDARELFQAIINDKTPELNNISLIENSIRHVEMLEQVFAKIKVLINNEKISPDDIVLVAPSMDGTLKHALKEFFELENIDYQFLTGSKKIFDDPLVFGTLIILQLINEEWRFKPKTFEIRSLLTGMLGIPTVFCEEILEKYENTRYISIPDCHSESFSSKNLSSDENSQMDRLPPSFSILNRKSGFPTSLRMTDRTIEKLITVINDLKSAKQSLSMQVEKIFSELILPNINENQNLEDFNRMVESLLNFEKLQNKVFSDKDWLILMKDTVVSDNPSYAPEIKGNCVKIATPQKVIDLEIESKIQIWLDVSSRQWMKDDTGPLYNAWVFNKNWQQSKYTPQIHKKLTLEKTAHVLRKLVLLCDDKIFCYASQLDVSGAENDGGIESFISEVKEKTEIKFEFTPRKDQAAVLEYKSGKMAISAVPGAGKTKILEALIIKLIQDGINPEEILVLTYMDSAARNIRERIKTSCPDLVKFPHISTIHGLGLSIIKNGDNSTKIGLDADFDICDDTLKFKIMQEIYNKLIKDNDYQFNSFNYDYPNAISQAKFLEITSESIGKYLSNKSSELYRELFDFYPVYAEYKRILKERSMIDFDDLLIYSVELLKNHPEIKKHFQEKFKYIIEDEAQDSSSVQQKLFGLLSENNGNLIRCGDPNQAITSSFSNSDVTGFKEFIKTTNNLVEMDHSQRCVNEVFELANSLVDWAGSQELLKDAFIPLKIHAVEGKNPETKDCLSFKIYETADEEKAKILKEIQKLKKSAFNFTIGVLLRTNSAVIEWAQFLEANNIPFICYSESVAQKKVFRFIKAYLEALNNPWNNKLIKILYEEFVKSNILQYEFDAAHFLEKAGSPFICFGKEDLPTETLGKFQDEVLKWLDKSNLPPEEIIAELGASYFDSVIDKSNARIISLLVSRFRRYDTDNEENKTVNLPEILNYLSDLGGKKSLSGVKFFNEIEKDDDKYEFVQIMTAHKAKGLEFDAVFMPEMQEVKFSYPVTPEVVDIGRSGKLINQIRQIKKLHKSVDIIKLEQIHEHLRLIYVGITRARHYLYMSGNEKAKNSWNKTKEYKPSKVLEYFINKFSSCHCEEAALLPTWQSKAGKDKR